MGVLSLIVWTLLILVSIEYAWLAMSLGHRGEGGTIVLREILMPLLKSGRQASFVTFLAYIGISLLVGDGVITPAISILSAVEGIALIPGLEKTGQGVLLMIAALIAIVLFLFQRKGTEKISGVFGPLMMIWFFVLSFSGILSIIQVPSVLKAVNPYYAVRFLSENGIVGFMVLSEVILCATGGEALYADMGHLGRKPIVRAWYFVFAALILNYLGQGAYLVQHQDAGNVLFEMMYHQAPSLYVFFLILSILATVIASQAMISGMFSIVYQGITTHIMPLFKVDYTSRELRSQIYIGFVNWFLLAAVLFIMVLFRASSNLAAAYGLAVTGTMTLTGILMTWIFIKKRKPWKAAVSVLVTFADIMFLSSNSFKIPHGGYWSLVIAAIPLIIILVYTNGQKRLYKALKLVPLHEFLERYNLAYRTLGKIKGTALYFLKDSQKIPPFMFRSMFVNGILYEDNVIVTIIKRSDPFAVAGYFKEDLAPGLRQFEIQLGYMEMPDIEQILEEAGIKEKTIFYGLEDITTTNVIWRIFTTIKKQAPAFVQFYRLPAHKLHGIMTRVEM
jgi:KUP system potassium uptake protein